MTLPIRPSHARILAELQERAPEVKVVLIGAAALHHHVPLPRKTSDVDLAIVLDTEQLEPLFELVKCRRDPGRTERWNGPDDLIIDALPATTALIAEGSITLGPHGRIFSLVGFDLALAYASEEPLPETSHTMPVASLASLVVLKMVAWLDRPGERMKDLSDLAHVLVNALTEDAELRWDPDDSLTKMHLDFEHQSPFYVGQLVAGITNTSHRTHVQRFLRCLAEPHHRAEMARRTGLRGPDADDRVDALLSAFSRGLEHPRLSPACIASQLGS